MRVLDGTDDIISLLETAAPIVGASAESHTGTTGSASEASFDFTLALEADCRGVLVFTFVNANADNATSVKVDPAGANIDVPAVTGGRAAASSAEPGDCKAWFIGAGLSAVAGTTVTIRVNRTNNANVMYALAVSIRGTLDLRLAGNIVLLTTVAALAQQAIDSKNRNALRFAGVNSGLAAPPPAGAASTALQSIDFGARVIATVVETTAGSGSRNVGFTDAGSDDRAAVHLAIAEKHPLDFERTDPFSLAFTFTSTDAGLAVPISKREPSGGNVRGWQFVTFAGGSFSFALISVTGGVNELASQTNNSFAADGSLRRVVVTYDGSSTPGGLHIYVAGVDEALTNTANTLTTTIVNDHPLLLGATGGLTPEGHLLGSIAEVGIWDAVLNAAEADSYNDGFSPLLIRPQSLVAYLPLLGNNSPEQELINGLNGTLTGTTKGDHPRVLAAGGARR